jgi:pimeloyl-ACP methyl ester carboxylesterase
VLPDDANNFAYLFVPGLFTEHYPGYMRENVRRMKQRGCTDVVMSKIDTDASVRTNAAKLKEEIEEIERRTGKKVVLIGHSKGGVDAGAALQLYPELRSKVQAFVSLQAPFGGTPIASDIGENENLRRLMSGFIAQMFQGDPTSLSDLAYKARRELLGDRVQFTADVPTFSFASKSRDPASLTALAALYGRERYGVDGDGLVLWKDALIPGSRGFMILDELDHAGPAMGGTIFSKFRPGDITEATIALALRHSR